MNVNMREKDELEFNGPCNKVNNDMTPSTRALGLDALHSVCRELYPNQTNPLTVTAILKFWLGGPDPLDYISMYENPGNPELGIPPHWHYISLGLSDLHGDGRLHAKSMPGQPSGFGFELTFRLLQEPEEKTPPTWPANVMQQLAKYVFTSGNMLLPGDHVSWHSPLGKENSRITQILMAKDPQLPESVSTPHGLVSFVQIVGVTPEELQAAQHWNGQGMINLLKTVPGCGPWLITNVNRAYSAMEDPMVAEQVQNGIEREGSNLSGVSAKCWWVQMENNISLESYREKRKDSDDEDDGDFINKFGIKTESMQDDGSRDDVFNNYSPTVKTLPGLHLSFNLEAGRILPLAIKLVSSRSGRGRIMHGRHFTFKSVLSHTATTFVAPSVTGKFVSSDKPFVVQGPWLQVLINDELAVKMAEEFQIFNSLTQVQLPKTFSWPDYNLAITIVSD
ncbi:Similar to Sufu: Suppressor of fused homolog (Mus musculus) [Cotesia congregata]|uniref:Similar to Sufu: Suppressor of fused homolog (Mus musculus) n=1 Tax=Cotesia congregata TaxID=51543 RepID=A0A8J2H3F4_COTCN|nr:Similar to Sufu: Suppressor of fused homolog (Mus musculus) [Cotesia congregata]